jgi:AcrR family transcriptional regulator
MAVAGRKLPYKPRLARERRRALIEQSAAALFAERGYDGVSIDDIVAAAGISKPTLYDHFASKRKLYAHLLQAQSEEMVAYMALRVRASTGSPRDQLREVLDAFFAFVEDHPFAWRMLFREPPADPGLARGARRIHQRASENVAALLRRVEPSKRRLPEYELEVRAEALKWAQQGLAAWWYDHQDTPRAQLVDVLVAMTASSAAVESWKAR